MANRCIRHNCPDCGDDFIHQTDRRGNESSSAYGQHIHDTYPIKFDWSDIDGVIYKVWTGILRVIEHKPLGQPLKNSQRRILPLLAAAVDVLAAEDVVHADSGVFLVNSDWPYAKSQIRRFHRDDHGTWRIGGPEEAVELTGDDLANFETGLPVNRPGLIGRAVL